MQSTNAVEPCTSEQQQLLIIAHVNNLYQLLLGLLTF